MGESAGQSGPHVTPMMRQYARAKAEYADAIVLFRLGDFYEMFGDDAHVGARVLELVLTSREAGKGNRLPMCGVPVHAVESYIARLLDAGYKVAVCEQMEDARLARGLVRREVIRVLTPGTVVEESMLAEDANNFLAAVYDADEAFGLASLDVSTGEFQATTLRGGTALEALHTELARLRPAECLLTRRLDRSPGFETLRKALPMRCTVCEETTFALPEQADLQHWNHDEHTPLALRAAGAILGYLQITHKAIPPHLTALQPYSLTSYMVLDAITRRNLELVRTMHRGERQGSVLAVLDETTTAMGARLLRRWLEQPLCDLAAIRRRQEAVAELVTDADRRQRLQQALRGIYDIERLLGRLACGTANARQLAALRQSLERLPHLRQALHGVQAALLRELGAACAGEDEIVALLQQAIVDDPPHTVRDGGMIREGYQASLDTLRRETERHTRWIARLQQRERQRTGIKSLKVGYNQVFGYYIEVSKANLGRVPSDYVRKQTLTNGERYITEALKEREVAILHASEQRASMEYELFVAIRDRIAERAAALQDIAGAVARLDTLTSLAEVAVLHDYTCPTVEDSARITVRQGRHPVVEQHLDGFVPNDVSLDRESRQLLLITGPNMAGKSTYLRQVALITILAQMGGCVPAREATIGLVDRLFTRVGAVDDIAAGRSTFLVEMTETAHILHNATPRSLIVLDEIGKGTSTFEGLSIAWGVALYIVRRLGTRALFATHYHELTALETLAARVHNLQMAVQETPDGIVFLRQVVPGGASKSYGLHVARLAGLPAEVLQEASRVLSYLEQQESTPRPHVPVACNGAPPDQASPLARQLIGLDICQITPLQALTVLHDLQQQARALASSNGAA
jgi:DNA mismatch repair protein MutS